jgi:hypothetical protein
MTYTRFCDIMAAICYTDKDAPLLFKDKFHKVHQMIDAFNDHYTSEYPPSWLNCINKSSAWDSCAFLANRICKGMSIIQLLMWIRMEQSQSCGM